MRLKNIVCSMVIAASMLSAVEPAYAEVNMDFVTDSLGKYSQPIESRLNAAPETIQNNWNLYADYIRISDAQLPSQTAYFSYTNGIFVNLEEDAKKNLNVQVAQKYSSLFHEIGHNIGYTLSDLFTEERGDCISNTYESKKYHCTLNAMLNLEGQSYFYKIRKKTKSDRKAWAYIDKELKSLDMYASYEVSDIWDEISKGKAKAYCGHTIAVDGEKYWDNCSVGCEAFANMYEASITNPKGMVLIKKYFPRSWEIFVEELNLTKE